jgi:glycosyltransferase involved in cell wall biosynthesis
MACGTPVLASTAGALPEVVGEAAIPLDPKSSTQIAAVIDDFLQSSALQQQLAQQGPQRAAEFSWARTSAELKQRLQALSP